MSGLRNILKGLFVCVFVLMWVVWFVVLCVNEDVNVFCFVLIKWDCVNVCNGLGMDYLIKWVY